MKILEIIKNMFDEMKVNYQLKENQNSYIVCFTLDFEVLNQDVTITIDKEPTNDLYFWAFNTNIKKANEINDRILQAINDFNHDSVYFKAYLDVNENTVNIVHFDQNKIENICDLIRIKLNSLMNDDCDNFVELSDATQLC